MGRHDRAPDPDIDPHSQMALAPAYSPRRLRDSVADRELSQGMIDRVEDVAHSACCEIDSACHRCVS